MFRNFTLLLAGLAGFTLLHGQAGFYKPFNYDSVAVTKIQQEIRQQFIKDSMAVTGEWKNKKRELLSDRFSAMQLILKDRQVITDTAVNRYLNKMLLLIAKGNPQYNFSTIRLLVSSTYIPNASSWGDGTIIYNAGLLCRMQNEAQAAFVLCHELAHYFLDHSNRRMDGYLQSMYSKETQVQLERLKKTEFNKYDELKKLSEKIQYGSTHYSRTYESQADSMGFRLFKNTAFDPAESIQSLALLDSIDKYKYDNPLLLKERFSSDSFVFRDAWIKKQTGLSSMALLMDKADSVRMDSLKSHPDIPERIKALTPLLNTATVTGEKFMIDAVYFEKLKSNFDYEIIEYCYQTGRVSRALLYSLQLLAVHPNDGYLNAITGFALTRLYAKQKEHHLNDVTDTPSPFADETYNSLLRMINRVRLDDFAAMSNAWAQKNRSLFENQEDFLYFLIENAGINAPAEKARLISRYQQLYPDGKYKLRIQ